MEMVGNGKFSALKMNDLVHYMNWECAILNNAANDQKKFESLKQDFWIYHHTHSITSSGKCGFNVVLMVVEMVPPWMTTDSQGEWKSPTPQLCLLSTFSYESASLDNLSSISSLMFLMHSHVHSTWCQTHLVLGVTRQWLLPSNFNQVNESHHTHYSLVYSPWA